MSLDRSPSKVLGAPVEEGPLASLAETRATELLTAQHRALAAMIAQLRRDPRRSAQLVESLGLTLCAHIATERELFYPAVRHVASKLVLEGYQEHAATRAALDRLLATRASGRPLDTTVTHLAHVFEDHVDEEEEELFPKAERALGARSFALAASMKARFDALIRGDSGAGDEASDEART